MPNPTIKLLNASNGETLSKAIVIGLTEALENIKIYTVIGKYQDLHRALPKPRERFFVF